MREKNVLLFSASYTKTKRKKLRNGVSRREMPVGIKLE